MGVRSAGNRLWSGRGEAALRRLGGGPAARSRARARACTSASLPVSRARILDKRGLMNARTPTPLAPLLAAGGALLLFISLFVNWFSLDGKTRGVSESIGAARPDAGTVLLVAIAGLAALVAIGRIRGMVAGKAELLTGLGAIAFLYVVVNIFKKPQLLDLVSGAFDTAKDKLGAQLSASGTDFSVGLSAGIWIALVGSLLLLAAGLSELLGVPGGGSGRGTGAGATPPPPGAGAGGPGGPGAIGGPGPAPGPGTTAPGGPAAGGAMPGGPAAGGATSVGTPMPAVTPPVGAAPPPDPSPGWKPDPYGQAQQRYWDGSSWTQHTG